MTSAATAAAWISGGTRKTGHTAEAGMAKPAQRKRTTRARRGGLTRRDLAMLPVVVGALASGRAQAETTLAIENASLAHAPQAPARGTITTRPLPPTHP